jgi:hypothetical protein
MEASAPQILWRARHLLSLPLGNLLARATSLGVFTILLPSLNVLKHNGCYSDSGSLQDAKTLSFNVLLIAPVQPVRNHNASPSILHSFSFQ